VSPAEQAIRDLWAPVSAALTKLQLAEAEQRQAVPAETRAALLRLEHKQAEAKRADQVAREAEPRWRRKAEGELWRRRARLPIRRSVCIRARRGLSGGRPRARRVASRSAGGGSSDPDDSGDSDVAHARVRVSGAAR
jgi:hypothetical protein